MSSMLVSLMKYSTKLTTISTFALARMDTRSTISEHCGTFKKRLAPLLPTQKSPIRQAFLELFQKGVVLIAVDPEICRRQPTLLVTVSIFTITYQYNPKTYLSRHSLSD